MKAVILILLFFTCCSSTRNTPVDYSYTQDNRDSIIARVHHYEITHKEPDISERAERRIEIVVFIIFGLIVILLQ